MIFQYKLYTKYILIICKKSIIRLFENIITCFYIPNLRFYLKAYFEILENIKNSNKFKLRIL